MKKQTYLPVLLIVLFAVAVSCSKKSSNMAINPNLKRTFKFTGNDTMLEWDGICTISVGFNTSGLATEGSLMSYSPKYISSPAYYQLIGTQGGTGPVPQISLGIMTDNLIVGAYNLTKTNNAPDSLGLNTINSCLMPNSAYSYSDSGDFVTVNITSIHDGGYADGTFIGLMTNSSTGSTNKLQITNGEFHNIKIPAKN